MIIKTAGVAKWLRHWVVIPTFEGSIPFIRPLIILFKNFHIARNKNYIYMVRYRGPRLRITRRLGDLPGLTRKIIPNHKSFSPGQHGRSFKKPSDYLIRLKEKQKLRFNYGVSEQQLYRYVQTARKSKGATGSVILQLLEMRLDTTLFRAGFAPTIPAARQIISHSHVEVNGRKVNIASFLCKKDDKIEINQKAKKFVAEILKTLSTPDLPNHLKVNKENLIIEVIGIADSKQSSIRINELLVVEYYSQR